MDQLARSLLEKLLRYGEKATAGVGSRVALTSSHLKDYRKGNSLQAKESFEITMSAARAEGAVVLTYDDHYDRNSFIKRVEIADLRLLAVFLGHTLLSDVLETVSEQFEPHLEKYPVLNDVIVQWSQVSNVRTLSPASVPDWLDAIRVIESADNLRSDEMFLPIREASSRLFKDSKRIEKLSVTIDILLCGSIEGLPRDARDVWGELGLFREEHPALLAGNVVVKRERVISPLDKTYSGLPANTVLGLSSMPSLVMTIENLTTFHSEARRRHADEVLLIYTGGMPSPAWRSMYKRILLDLAIETPIYHWGDIDEGGFRIAAKLAQDAISVGHKLRPWKMHPDDIPSAIRCEATTHTLNRMRYFAEAAGWSELGDAIAEAGFTIEQEGL